jgi:hypothetical protein
VTPALVGMQPMRCHKCQPVPYGDGIEPERVCTCASPSSKAVPASSEEKLRLATDALRKADTYIDCLLLRLHKFVNPKEINYRVRDEIQAALARIRGEKPGEPAPP